MGESRTLLETIADPEPAAFPGLYTPSLPIYPFIAPGQPSTPAAEKCIVVSSVWRHRTTVLAIGLESGKVVDLTPDTDQHWSWTVLATDGQSQAICTRSALNKPPELVLGHINSNLEVKWRVLGQPILSDDRKLYTPAKDISDLISVS